jgi:hypothetical protein
MTMLRKATTLILIVMGAIASGAALAHGSVHFGVVVGAPLGQVFEVL